MFFCGFDHIVHHTARCFPCFIQEAIVPPLSGPLSYRPRVPIRYRHPTQVTLRLLRPREERTLTPVSPARKPTSLFTVRYLNRVGGSYLKRTLGSWSITSPTKRAQPKRHYRINPFAREASPVRGWTQCGRSQVITVILVRLPDIWYKSSHHPPLCTIIT